MFNPFASKKKDEFEQQKELQDMASQDTLIASETSPEREDIAAKAFIQEQRNSLTRWQQDLEPDLLQMVHDLKKETITGVNEEGQPIWALIEGTEAVCNDGFVMRFVTKMRPLMSKNLMMSNFSEERILKILRFQLIELILDVGGNHEKYDIDLMDMDHIIQVFKNYVTPTLFRPMQQGERKHIGTTYSDKSIRTVNEGEVRKKKTLLGF